VRNTNERTCLLQVVVSLPVGSIESLFMSSNASKQGREEGEDGGVYWAFQLDARTCSSKWL
jgi:hypothetical protein